jgi:hypothetical protein
MTQEKHSSSSSGLFGLTGRDIILLFLLIVALGINFIPNPWLAGASRDVISFTSTPTATSVLAIAKATAFATSS